MSVTKSGPQMSEARRYQQLRAHFSAEALPRVLDAARTENLSLTAALERLLEIEVTATEERRLPAGPVQAGRRLLRAGTGHRPPNR